MVQTSPTYPHINASAGTPRRGRAIWLAGILLAIYVAPLASAAPAASSASCSTCVADGGTYVLTVYGSGFTSSSTLRTTAPDGTWYDSAAHRLTVVSSSQINYNIIPPTGKSGAWTVVVKDGSLTSGPASFTVAAPPSAPTVTSASCSSCVADGAQHALTVTGTGFASGYWLYTDDGKGGTYWSDSTRIVSLSSTQIVYNMIPPVGRDGSWTVKVYNADKTLSSGTASFTVAAPPSAPTVTPADSNEPETIEPEHEGDSPETDDFVIVPDLKAALLAPPELHVESIARAGESVVLVLRWDFPPSKRPVFELSYSLTGEIHAGEGQIIRSWDIGVGGGLLDEAGAPILSASACGATGLIGETAALTCEVGMLAMEVSEGIAEVLESEASHANHIGPLIVGPGESVRRLVWLAGPATNEWEVNIESDVHARARTLLGLGNIITEEATIPLGLEVQIPSAEFHQGPANSPGLDGPIFRVETVASSASNSFYLVEIEFPKLRAGVEGASGFDVHRLAFEIEGGRIVEALPADYEPKSAFEQGRPLLKGGGMLICIGLQMLACKVGVEGADFLVRTYKNVEIQQDRDSRRDGLLVEEEFIDTSQYGHRERYLVWGRPSTPDSVPKMKFLAYYDVVEGESREPRAGFAEFLLGAETIELYRSGDSSLSGRNSDVTSVTASVTQGQPIVLTAEFSSPHEQTTALLVERSTGRVLGVVELAYADAGKTRATAVLASVELPPEELALSFSGGEAIPVTVASIPMAGEEGGKAEVPAAGLAWIFIAICLVVNAIRRRRVA